MMIIKIIKIDGEFAIIELENKMQKVCPVEILPDDAISGDLIKIQVVKKD